MMPGSRSRCAGWDRSPPTPLPRLPPDRRNRPSACDESLVGTLEEFARYVKGASARSGNQDPRRRSERRSRSLNATPPRSARSRRIDAKRRQAATSPRPRSRRNRLRRLRLPDAAACHAASATADRRQLPHRPVRGIGRSEHPRTARRRSELTHGRQGGQRARLVSKASPSRSTETRLARSNSSSTQLAGFLARR